MIRAFIQRLLSLVSPYRVPEAGKMNMLINVVNWS